MGRGHAAVSSSLACLISQRRGTQNDPATPLLTSTPFQRIDPSHDDRTRTPRCHVFLGLPVTGGSTDHFVNKPPSGGFVV
jgi:hypothetical protein